MKAIAGKEIRVIEPTSDFRRMVEKELIVANPEYARKQKMGKWVGGTPSTIKFYRTEGKEGYYIAFRVSKKLCIQEYFRR